MNVRSARLALVGVPRKSRQSEARWEGGAGERSSQAVPAQYKARAAARAQPAKMQMTPTAMASRRGARGSWCNPQRGSKLCLGGVHGTNRSPVVAGLWWGGLAYAQRMRSDRASSTRFAA